MESISSSSESDELLALPKVNQDENYEPAPKKRMLLYVKKSTTPRALRAGTSASTPPARQQKSKVIFSKN